MPPELNSSSSNNFSSQTPQLQKLHGAPKLCGAVVQTKMEFWSTPLAAPKFIEIDLFMELQRNYPPLTLVTHSHLSNRYL
jgi:hypothetical protein